MAAKMILKKTEIQELSRRSSIKFQNF